MSELKDTKLQRPMEKTGDDVAVLRGLVGLMNDPNVTGAVVPPEEKLPTSGLIHGTAPHLPPNAPPTSPPMTPIDAVQAEVKVIEPPKPRPVTTPPPEPVRGKKLFFTGHPRAGKSYLAAKLGARVFEFLDPALAMAAAAFGGDTAPGAINAFLAEVAVWGEGEVTDRYPLTTTRAMFLDNIREAGESGDRLFGVSVVSFGTQGFWARSLLARVKRYQQANPRHMVAVTNVTTPDQYNALRNAGFSPYHVMCNALTRSSRGGSETASQQLAESIERDITRKISESPHGKRLWCVWCDEKYPVLSPRILTVQEFLQSAMSV